MEMVPRLAESEKILGSHIRASGMLLSEKIDQSHAETVSRIEQRLDTFSAHITSHVVGADGLSGPLRTGFSRSIIRAKQQPNPVHNHPFESMDALFLGSASLGRRPVASRWNRSSFARCKPKCRCQCHRRPGGRDLVARWDTQYFEKVFGSATLDYFGFLTRWKCCDDMNCRSHRAGEIIKFHYRFPSWLVNIAVSLLFSTRFFGSPELLLRIYNVLPRGGAMGIKTIFSCASRGDVHGLKQILRERPGCVYDVRGDNNKTALWYAVATFKNKAATVRLLLQAGADPWHEDDKLHSPIQRAMESFEDQDGQLDDCFPFRELMQDEDKYTILHRIILGQLPLDLASELKKAGVRALLETPSWTGNVPLHLAARRGDAHALSLLLEAGADVASRRSDTGDLAIHCASRVGSAEVARLLVENGSAINAPGRFGKTPLHFAAFSGSTETLALLLDNGADLDMTDLSGSLALASAVMAERPEAVGYLLDRGVDIDHRDFDGDVALTESVVHRSAKSAALLLERGADYTNVNNDGRSILHILAVAGDIKMLHVFTQVAMAGLDAERMDNNGKTPRQLFEERPDVNETIESFALRSAFNDLMASAAQEGDLIDSGFEEMAEDEMVEDESDQDEFFDAMEKM
ncbi:ankyrin repeat-containing domain protein [Apodospora peruviana]|uniref:Ankyrin repeat-containing domain protein n=1 Tax=Apodospora peruviana TaxID=516989 RepID=A0AAE0IBC6_9PEZI|nr:ankyrin repeat-containing domain protein [Apodospora peruviana]